MTDTRIGVEFSAKTDAAVTEVNKLSASIRDQTTAATVAGNAQEQLGKDVAVTRARQIEATEAVRRAKDAQNEHTLVVQAFGSESRQAAQSAARLTAAQQDAKRASDAAAESLESTAKAASAVAAAEDGKLSAATKRAAAQLARMGQDAERTTGDLRKLDLAVIASASAAEKGQRSFAGFLGSFAGNVAAGAVGHLASGLREGAAFVLETAASYETLRTSLETVTGSSAKAAIEFERLQSFAAATPFGVAEVTDAYIKLANRGIQPTDRALTSFGNTASAMGKTLDDMVEAVADAVTGENERLKELGVIGKLAGDQVMYTFRGVTTAVKRDAASIAEYLTRLGENNFAGGMEKQSQSLSGMWSTLNDNFALFADQLVQGGVGDALKEIMGGLTGATGGAEGFAKSLGKDLGDAIRLTAQVLGLLVGALKLVAEGWHAVSGAITDSKQIYALAEDQQRKLHGEIGVLEERLIDSTRAMDGARDSMSDWIAASTLGTNAQLALADATNVARRAAWEASVQQARLAAAQEDRARTAAAFTANEEAKQRNAQRRAMEGELSGLMADKSLSPSEKKRKGELMKELDVAAPKKGKAKKKDPNKLASDQMDFDADVAVYEAKLAKDLRKENLADQEAAFERESALRERRLSDLDREMELLDARGAAEAERIDAVFFMVDLEGEAEARRRELQDSRIAREEELARWQVTNAKSEADREKARTRLDEVEHKKRLLVLNRATAEEKKTLAARQAMVEKVTTHVTGLADALVSGLEAAAEGEKGAVAKAVGSYLKGVSVRMSIKALEESVLAVASAASYNYPAAAAHGTAAGMAIAAATAAGVGAGTFTAIGNARADSGGGGGESVPSTPTGAGASATGGGIQREAGAKLEGQEVPVSFEERRRSAPHSTMADRQIQITVNVGTMLGDKDKKQLGQDLARMIREAEPAGRRY